MERTEWIIAKIIRCERINQEAALMERRRYPGNPETQDKVDYIVEASGCSHDLECNLNDHIHCRWSFKGGDDPFAEASGLQ
jgi:hypothetical protein